MKTILEIQKLDKKISDYQREVEKCPASIEFNNYKKVMQEGKARFAQLEAQANEIIKIFNRSNNKYDKVKGNTEILKKRNSATLNLQNASNLISEANAMVGELSEENRRVEELVRKAEEIVRKSAELSNKLQEAKIRANAIKLKIEQKRQEVAPKIIEIEQKIKELEPKVKDTARYEQYKQLKEKIKIPIFVNIEDNFCGGCKVELPLNFIERLKEKTMLPCDHCGRIIMLNK